MTFDIWKGPKGQASAPTSGDFMIAANWSTGAVPDQTIDALFGPGDYTAATSFGVTVRSFSVGTGATLALAGDASSLTTSAGSTNGGTVRVSGGFLVLGGDLANFGTLFGEAGEYFFAEVGGAGAIFNEGTITGTNVLLQNTVYNDAGGVIRANGGSVTLVGMTNNTGLVEALNGGTVSSTGYGIFGIFTNFANGVLNGGTWAATGAGATILLANETVNVLDAGATVILTGAGSNVRVDDGGASPFYLEQTLGTVAAGASLQVLGGRDYTTTESLMVAGTLLLGGGALSAGDLRGGTGSTIGGFGEIAVEALTDGTVRADVNLADRQDTLNFTDTTDFNGRVSGRGTLELSGGADTFTTSHVTVRALLIDGADVQLDAALRYAGHLTLTTGLLDLKDATLTLAGATTLAGGAIEGGPRGRLVIAGGLDAEADAAIDVQAVRVDGTVAVDHAVLSINGSVTGAGGFVVGTLGTLLFDDASRLSATPLVTLAGTRATVAFDNLDSIGARVAGFDGRDRIDFTSFATAAAKLFWRADDDGTGGTLRLVNAAQTATVHLEENHLRADFAFAGDGTGGTVVTRVAGGAAGGAFASASADAFGDDAPSPGSHPFSHPFSQPFLAGDLHGAFALA